MKKFAIGLLAGYLLTSIFSIPALPIYFWYFWGGMGVISLILWNAWVRFNDDIHEGEF
mgnify:FL=1